MFIVIFHWNLFKQCGTISSSHGLALWLPRHQYIPASWLEMQTKNRMKNLIQQKKDSNEGACTFAKVDATICIY